MRPVLFVCCATLSACQSIDVGGVRFDENACHAVAQWAEAAGAEPRIGHWNWRYPDDVIPMRARLEVCASGACEVDEFDIALYEGVSRYTHSFDLGEFVYLTAACFDVRARYRIGEYGETEFAAATVELEDVLLERRFERGQCPFRDGEFEPTSAGCASFRASRSD